MDAEELFNKAKVAVALGRRTKAPVRTNNHPLTLYAFILFALSVIVGVVVNNASGFMEGAS